MDFLKFAVASAISKSSSFPVSIGDKVDVDQSIWTLNNGTKRVIKARIWIVYMLNFPRTTAQTAVSSPSILAETNHAFLWLRMLSKNSEHFGTLVLSK
jgi:hypothetical protein